MSNAFVLMGSLHFFGEGGRLSSVKPCSVRHGQFDTFETLKMKVSWSNKTQRRWIFLLLWLLFFGWIITSIIREEGGAYLSCPRRTGSVVQGLTTGGKCYHWNPHDRSYWPTRPPPLSHSELWGTDLGYLWKYKAAFEVMTVTGTDYCSGAVVTLF